MGEKIVVGPVNQGLRTEVLPFAIDNDSFPTLVNAYQWRGRVKRKRGTRPLGTPGRLNRNIGTTDGVGNATISILPVTILTGIVSFTIGTDIFVDPGTTANPATQTLITNSSGTGTLNRVSGVLTITGSQANTSIIYYPTLPVMGEEDLVLQYTDFPGTIAFDTTYAYNIKTNSPFDNYDVSFYKNPSADPTNLPGYVPKGTWTPTSWNGQNYQQFWSTNYQGAFWATNGINVPFSITNVGMQYNTITAIGGVVAGPPAFATITTTTNHGLVIGDFVFINEVNGLTGINFQTGYVTAVPAANQITVEFPNATFGGAYTTGGIVQYLTNRSDTSKDCLRWYDGDPTIGVSPYNSFATGKGWVNFCPPLSQDNFSIAGLPAAKYYLVGARMIVPFKDRLLFLGPVVQTSTAGSQIYLQDTIIYSQNGTAFYTCSFTGDPLLPTTTFHPILVPINQTATAPAYFEDQTGFGGFFTAGVDQPMITSSSNEDVLIIGFSSTIQARLVYSGNDIVPFNLFLINSELGSSSTFSAINMDRGVISRGSRGYIITSQTECRRVDLQIPDQVFQIKLSNNGNERMCSQRDYINEWIYFTYPSNELTYNFPNQTLLYNYREDSYAIFNETYTTYGAFRKASGQTWATLSSSLTWASWNSPWNSGDSTLLNPEVIAGNQQGFIFFREDEETEESDSLYIQNISSNTISSPNHCLNNGDYIIISGCQGTIASQVNGKIFSVAKPDTNTFKLNPPIGSGTYLGGGYIKRMYVPFIQTKQFPVSWAMARKTRLGPQQYLLTTTNQGQITLQIYLSQNDASPYNGGTIVPATIPTLPQNNSLIYSSILYTCPESTNLGLTPANINLQMVTALNQQQIWHRMNTSLLGDTVQIGFTMSDDQMRDINFNNQFSEIEVHGFILDVNPSQILA